MKTTTVLLMAATAGLLAAPLARAGEFDELKQQIAEARQELDAAARKLSELYKQQFVAGHEEGDHKKAMLGILLGDEKPRGDGPRGVELYGVTPGGGAAQAGLATGDVITRVNSVAVAEADDPTAALVAHMKGVAPGEVVMVEYVRDGETFTAAITTQPRSVHRLRILGDHDFDFDFDFEFDPREFAAAGVPRHLIPKINSSVEHSSSLMAVSGNLAKYFDVDEGVLVVSPPEGSELEAGDIVLAVAGDAVTDVADAQRRLASIEDSAKVRVKRAGRQRTVDVRAGEFSRQEIRVIRVERRLAGGDDEVEIIVNKD